MRNFLHLFPGQESVVAAAARVMRDRGLAPDDVLAAYEEWLDAMMADAVPAGGGKREAGKAALNRSRAKLNPPRSPLKKRHKAGDFAVMPRACPRCGGDAQLYQMCPIDSPVWRTQLACMTDGCAWHGRSRLPIDALLAAGASNIKNNVSEG